MARRKPQLISDWLTEPDEHPRERLSDWLETPTPRQNKPGGGWKWWGLGFILAGLLFPPLLLIGVAILVIGGLTTLLGFWDEVIPVAVPAVKAALPQAESAKDEPGNGTQSSGGAVGRSRWKLLLAGLAGASALFTGDSGGLILAPFVFLVSFLLLTLVEWAWKWRKVLIAGGLVAALGMGGLVFFGITEFARTRQFCLPEEAPAEFAACLLLPIHDLPTLPPAGWLSELSSSPHSDSLKPLLLPLPSRRVLQPAVLEGQFTEDERLRFNECLSSLYEQPTVKLRNRLVLYQGVDADIADFVAVNALLKVCQVHVLSPIEEPVSYLARAISNGLIDHQRRMTRFVPELPEPPGSCWTDYTVLLSSEWRQWDRAFEGLSETQQRVYQRYMRGGGTWAEIGEDLNMTAKQASDHMKKAIDRLVDGVEESRREQCTFRRYRESY